MTPSRRDRNNAKIDARRAQSRAAAALVREYDAILHTACLECDCEYRGVGVDGRPGVRDYSIHLPVPISQALRDHGVRPFEGQTRGNGRPLSTVR